MTSDIETQLQLSSFNRSQIDLCVQGTERM